MRRQSCTSIVSRKMAVHQRDGYRCRYCGVMTSRRPENLNGPKGRTVDHVIPVSKGGRTNIMNLVTCCRRCNKQKLSFSLREANMRLLPRPDPEEIRIRTFDKKRSASTCVNCGLGSKRSHYPAPYHGGPKKCRTGDTYYLAQRHLDFLRSQGVC